MNILITGGNGFVGSHMIDYCLEKKHSVFGILRDHRSSQENIYHLVNKKSDLKLFYVDLMDAHALDLLFMHNKFDRIFHFAARSYVPSSFNNPVATLETNIIGTTNLLESVKNHNKNCRIIVASSSEVYGQVTEEDIPIKETCPLRPQSPYAVSKCGEDLISYQYHASYNIPIVRSRLFTHSGPRRGEMFFISAFAKQIAKIKLKLQEPIIKVGNLDSVRTICDIRDAIRAYWLLSEKGASGEVYNIGGKNTAKVGDILDQMIEISGIKCKIEVDKDLLRPSDVTLQIPCIDKFVEATGWEPEIPLETTLNDTINYWMEKLK